MIDMAADNTILMFKCLNPECAKPIKLRRPAKSGIYPVSCPHCKVTKKLNLKGLDAFEEQGGATAPDVPDNSAKPAVALTDDFLVGESYRIKCPHCGEQEIGLCSQKAGHKDFACPRCKGKIAAEVREKTAVLDVEETRPLIKGKLVMLRKWLNKSYPLGIGKHTVGRDDADEPSDIAIKNDSTVSRRSVCIEVAQTPKGYTFKLTVLKATNPVLHNETRLYDGESVSLNFGDVIVMGRTKFRFDKDI